jgi:hypothetical protein
MSLPNLMEIAARVRRETDAGMSNQEGAKYQLPQRSAIIQITKN